jgi:hypothetical protein
VLLEVPSPADVPPVPTVLLVWAYAESVVPARSAAASAARLTPPQPLLGDMLFCDVLENSDEAAGPPAKNSSRH